MKIHLAYMLIYEEAAPVLANILHNIMATCTKAIETLLHQLVIFVICLG